MKIKHTMTNIQILFKINILARKAYSMEISAGDLSRVDHTKQRYSATIQIGMNNFWLGAIRTKSGPLAQLR